MREACLSTDGRAYDISKRLLETTATNNITITTLSHCSSAKGTV